MVFFAQKVLRKLVGNWTFVVVTDRGREAIAAAAPGHVTAVRRLFLDALTPAQLDAVGDAAVTVLAALDAREPA